MYHLLLAYSDIFADKNDGLGRTGHVKHTINTRQPYRQLLAFEMELAQQLIQDLLKKNVIQPLASPVVLVQKKDGSVTKFFDHLIIIVLVKKF